MKRLTTLFCLIALPVLAGAPGRVNIQGVLRTESGALQDGTFAFRVQIFPEPSSAAAFLDETYEAVPVASGVFSVEVGAATPTLTASLAAATAPQVQVSVNGKALPRQALNSSFFALNAATVPFEGIQNKPAPTCPAGLFLKGIAADGTPDCRRLACVFRFNSEGKTSQVLCAANETLTGGGCSTASGAIRSSTPSTVCTQEPCNFQICSEGKSCGSPNAWTCAGTESTASAYAVCCTGI